jgi:hypothetical protein
MDEVLDAEVVEENPFFMISKGTSVSWEKLNHWF